ncbi:unnamed protein product [Rotaria magnacalcarata]|nr:unnamed protein product [Rotaria magnacalcarata]CAF2103857.1 unnamed protein product [Rotaria magnacalcarata]
MEKVSTFETLPDEMILHVCQYRRGGEILHSFFNLNSRLNSTITNFCHYVNLTNLTYQQFKNCQFDNSTDSLKKVLAANNNRLKSVSFDYDSTEFMLTSTNEEEAVSYPNIEELTVRLKTDKTLASVFILVPNITRLHVEVDELSSESKRTLENVPSLVHLKDFQLRSCDTQ